MKPDLINNAFALVLLKQRKVAGMSRKQLSEQSGISRAFISMLENGKRNASLQTVVSLACACKMTPANFVTLIKIELNTVEDMLERLKRDE